MKSLPHFRGSRLAARLSAPSVPRPSGDVAPLALAEPGGAPAVAPTVAAGGYFEQLQASRRVFWRVYNAWMAQASDQEVERLDDALQHHAPHVRPIHAAFGDAMRDRTSSMSLPLSLLAALDAGGWVPSDTRSAQVVSATRTLSASTQARQAA